MYVWRTHTPLPFMPKLCMSEVDTAALPTATGALQKKKKKQQKNSWALSHLYVWEKQRKPGHLNLSVPIIHDCNCTRVSLLQIWKTAWRYHHTWQHEIWEKKHNISNDQPWYMHSKTCIKLKRKSKKWKERNLPAPPTNFWSTGGHVLNTGRRAGWCQSTYTERWDNTHTHTHTHIDIHTHTYR